MIGALKQLAPWLPEANDFIFGWLSLLLLPLNFVLRSESKTELAYH